MKIENRFQSTSGAMLANSGAMLDSITTAGYSHTRSRRAVVEALCRTPSGLTPAKLAARARTFHTHLGTVTVYRTLELLESLGLARRIHTADGCTAWAPVSLAHGHHVVCRGCGRAAEFEGCNLEPLLRRVSQRTGFRISDHWLELFGLCPQCARGASQ